MIEHAGTPNMLVLDDWFTQAGYIFGLTDESPRRYIKARISTTTDEHRPTKGGRVYCVGDLVCVLSRPLGQLQ